MRFCLLLLLSCLTVFAESPQSIRAFYIGHSLISDIPDMVQSLAMDAGLEFTFKEQFVPGASLAWQWKEGRSGQEEPVYRAAYDKALPEGKFNAVILTDSVPRGGKMMEDETAEFLARFHAYALEQNPQCQVYYYETWHHITSGTPQNSEYDNQSPRRTLLWRERLDADQAMWDGIVTAANQINAGKGNPILLIPAGRALAKFEDAAKKGEVPGIKGTKDYFDDEIHVNPYGKYLIACVHFSVLFQRSPEGLTGDLKDRWGRSYWETPNWQKKSWARPSDETIAAIQRIAWEAVQSFNEQKK